MDGQRQRRTDAAARAPISVLLVALCVVGTPAASALSDQRLCADAECQASLGSGRTVLRYHATEPGMLSFAVDQPVNIYSKGAGSNPDLWGAEIGGRRGYVNSAHIQELRVLVKSPVYVVNVYAPPPASATPAEPPPPAEDPAPPPAQSAGSAAAADADPVAAAEADPAADRATTAEADPADDRATTDDDLDVNLAENGQETMEEDAEAGDDEEERGEVADVGEVRDEVAEPSEVQDYTGDEYIPPLTTESSAAAAADQTLEKVPEIDAAATETEGEQRGEDQEQRTVQETVQHYLEMAKDLMPEWLHKSLHGERVEGVSPRFALLLVTAAFTCLILHFVNLCMAKVSNEAPLKARVAELDRKFFAADNELKLFKREHEEALAAKSTMNGPYPSSSSARGSSQPPPPEPNAQLLEELSQLTSERERLLAETAAVRAEKDAWGGERQRLLADVQLQKSSSDRLSKELTSAESFAAELLEEKKSRSASVDGLELNRAVDTLREKLNGQKEAVHKYEARIKKREAELKEKTSELRRQRADTANAKLQLEKSSSETESLRVRLAGAEAGAVEADKEMDEMRRTIEKLEAVAQQFYRAKEEVESKDSELESRDTEIEVLQETIKKLEAAAAAAAAAAAVSTAEASTDGWDDGFDDDDEAGAGAAEAAAAIDIAAIQAASRTTVDLRRAQSACDRLSAELTSAESARDAAEADAAETKQELAVARAVREQALADKEELAHKHQVLTSYFNQRESELLKQLGLQSTRLGDAVEGTESAAKQMTALVEEVDAYKAQMKSLKLELEEQERSLKAQNASLEKKQHESWVTVRQESRRLAEAQAEMQSLRARLTVAETKLLEKELEVGTHQEETEALKEALENIKASQQQQQTNGVKAEHGLSNGTGLHRLKQYEDWAEVHCNLRELHVNSPCPLATSSTAGPPSLDSAAALAAAAADDPPPDLPILPMTQHTQLMAPLGLLPAAAAAAHTPWGALPFNAHVMPQPSMMAAHHHAPPDQSRPPPIGRRSPPPGRNRGGAAGGYSASPSPPPTTNSNDVASAAAAAAAAAAAGYHASGGGGGVGRYNHRDVSPARSDISRSSRSRFETSSYGRYSTHSNRSEQRYEYRGVDYEYVRGGGGGGDYGHYAPPPPQLQQPRDVQPPRRSSRDDFPGSGAAAYDDERDGPPQPQRRRRPQQQPTPHLAAVAMLDNVAAAATHRSGAGPKTSSPMVDQDGYNI